MLNDFCYFFKHMQKMLQFKNEKNLIKILRLFKVSLFIEFN